MICIFKSKCGTVAALIATAIICLGSSAQAQKPSEEQLSAIRSSCRSDFLSNCSGVPRGGKEALDCLRQHMAKLSPACDSAVKAVTPPPPATKAVPPPPPPAAAAPPPPPPAAAVSPAPSAAAPVPPRRVTAPAAPKAAKPKMEKAKTAAPPPPMPAAVAPPPIPLEKIEALSLPKRLAIVRHCRADLDAVCPSVKRGGGRVIACLAAHRPALSPPCRQTLEKELP